MMLPSVETVLVLAVEAPSLHLAVEPGEAGENAALFGDGAAACARAARRGERAALPSLTLA